MAEKKNTLNGLNIIQSVPYQIGLSLRFKDKNTHIILYYTLYLNFPISGENRNLEPITIRYDVGRPVYKLSILLRIRELFSGVHLNPIKTGGGAESFKGKRIGINL